MSEPLRVYVAGPLGYPRPGWLENVGRAEAIARQLRNAGHRPFVPHLYAYWDDHESCLFQGRTNAHATDADWLDLASSWIEVCHVFLRYSRDDSSGTDYEEGLASGLHMPVFESVEALLARHPGPNGASA